MSRKRSWAKYAWLLLIAIPALVFMGRWWVDQNSWVYPSLGVPVPMGYGSVGMDVSRWNGRIRWADVSTGSVRTDFVWIKATEGLELRDPNYRRNREGAKEAGLFSGAYHFFLPSLDPIAQARHFWKTADLKSGDLPPVLDLEKDGGLGNEALKQQVFICLKEMTRLCGCHPVVYTNQHFYQRVLRDRGYPEWDELTIWMAAYERQELPLIKQDPRIRFWQFAQTGQVNGIKEAVDLNVFVGDTAQLQTWIAESWTADPVSP